MARPTQLSLLDAPGPYARRTDPDTSHEAASAAQRTAASQRRHIVQALIVQGPMTGDGLDAFFDWPNATANRRLPELREARAVRMLEATVKTRRGRRAHLWEFVR